LSAIQAAAPATSVRGKNSTSTAPLSSQIFTCSLASA
jgi:hypothetical protein